MKKGFTLIEVITVILVLGIAASGLAIIMQQVLYDAHDPEAISVASMLAAGEAERVSSLSFANVTNESRDNPQAYADFTAYSRQVRVDSVDSVQSNLGSDPDMSDYKVVEVRVTRSGMGNLSMFLLRANN